MKRAMCTLMLLAIAGLVGDLIGTSAADSIGERAIRAHDKMVIATVEVAAKRYSVFVNGDQNLIPTWAQTPRVSMFELDDYYR